MEEFLFEVTVPNTQNWVTVPSVDEAQMREVDRIAMEDFNLGILQMMENAGRNLARQAFRFINENQSPDQRKKVLVIAGSGGNGGGGICAARHLHNHGVEVFLILSSTPDQITGAAQTQLSILNSAGLTPKTKEDALETIAKVDLVLDAIIGYTLKGAPRGNAKALIEAINQSDTPVISLDLPSGLDTSSGETPGVCVNASQTMSLALPKPGLANSICGDLYLADIGIPPEVYRPLGLMVEPFFTSHYILPMRSTSI
jgi:NAD(P)H-hydrate epimerase